MATLTIRNLPDEVHAALRVRAAQRGRSMEEEVRLIIASGLDIAGEPSASAREEALARADAAAENLRAALRAANNGELPSGMVDALIAERRAEVAREEAEYAQSVADRERKAR